MVPAGKKQFSVTLDESLLEELDRMAGVQHRSRSNMVEWLLARVIEIGKAVTSDANR